MNALLTMACLNQLMSWCHCLLLGRKILVTPGREESPVRAAMCCESLCKASLFQASQFLLPADTQSSLSSITQPGWYTQTVIEFNKVQCGLLYAACLCVYFQLICTQHQFGTPNPPDNMHTVPLLNITYLQLLSDHQDSPPATLHFLVAVADPAAGCPATEG